MRRVLPLLSTLLLAVTACSGGSEDPGPAATVGTAPTTTTTAPRPVDPAVVPADVSEIDETYVQAVVDALFAVDAEATKIFLETKNPLDERAIDYLEAIYVGDELDQQINGWVQTLIQRSDQILPGTLRHEVLRIINVAADCAFVEVERDFSETTTNAAPRSTTSLGLTPKRAGDDPNGINPTAWMLFNDSISQEGTELEDPCAGR